MKSLQTYITEVKIPFTLEEFEQFIKDEQYDEWEGPVYDQIVHLYGEDIAKMFCSWCGAYDVFKNQGLKIKDLYQLLQNLPDKTFKRLSGAGGYGIVFELSGNKVIKFNYLPTHFQPDLVFYEYCQKYHPACFPKIYKVGKNWVVMEKVKTGTPRTDLISKYSWKYHDKPDSELPPEMVEIREFFNEVEGHIRKMQNDFDKSANWMGDDIESRNCGERSNGQLVCFDPIAPNSWWE